jgi:predicted ATPase
MCTVSSRELAEQLLNMAERMGDPALLLEAHVRLGIASFFIGEPTTALEHWDKGIALYDPERHRSQAFVFGVDRGVLCLGYAAVALSYLGYPDQASKRSDDAIALARKVAHPFSLAFALFLAAWSHALRGNWSTAAAYAEATVAVSSEQGFVDWLLVGTFFRGWALAEQGRADEGIAQMRDALAAMPSIGFEINRPYYLAVLAAAYGGVGRTDDALALVAEALVRVDRSDEHWIEWEIYRVKVNLLLKCRGSSEAEPCFRRAIEIARRQSAKSLASGDDEPCPPSRQTGEARRGAADARRDLRLVHRGLRHGGPERREVTTRRAVRLTDEACGARPARSLADHCHSIESSTTLCCSSGEAPRIGGSHALPP